MSCTHTDLVCLNQFELIRKYRCRQCEGVMMCACDQEVGERYLAHQLREGSELETRRRVPVTLGFQPRICNECRGLPPAVAPVAAIHGRTSKISRYYWREIAFEKMRRLDERDPTQQLARSKAERDRIEREVIDHFKQLHATRPKYVYHDPSQEEVIRQTQTEVIQVAADHVKGPRKGVLIRHGQELVAPEIYAERYFAERGYQTIHCESRPFHVLFGTYMFLLIQDPADPRNRMVGFGSRTDYDRKTKPAEQIWTMLPEDFGAPGYYSRRQHAIAQHLETIDDSDWLFDYWTGTSDHLREYLWAHDPVDIATARRVRSILGLANLKKVLAYLVRDYWRNYCGWPDLLVFRPGEFFFVEVKSSKDKLSADQKRWMVDNREHLGFGFRILKICAVSSQEPSQGLRPTETAK